ncbi:conserved protein of unknown function [Candidatus Filomicrobium marinum]|uniref:Nucleotide-diphospho-sugar transferase domain-containing protein n=2 Tax=Candidatus Filomicrobium marinum TaxID=1608628 RepID=A0A0D6JBS2_9HYPH|nr:conserved protein of unknown function [Candidatus Filomicrobium marinum]
MIPMTYQRNAILGVVQTFSDLPNTLPTEVTSLHGGQRYVVCAFYTPSYLENVLRLKASLERLGLNYHLKCVEYKGSWEATTRLKPSFVVDCLNKFPDHDVLYLDADAVVNEKPVFFDTVTTDVALLFAPTKRARKPLLSLAAGTLYIRNTLGGRKFAEHWRNQESRSGLLTLDEDMIYMAFPNFEGITFTALPRAYSKIFDSEGPDAVIEHFQASRTQFKLSRLLRKGERAVVIASAVLVLAIIAIIWRQVL